MCTYFIPVAMTWRPLGVMSWY